jgi:hypothetical protein
MHFPALVDDLPAASGSHPRRNRSHGPDVSDHEISGAV